MQKRLRKRDFYSVDRGKKAGKTSGPVRGLLFFVCYFCGIWGYLRLCSLIFVLNYSRAAVVYVLALSCMLCWFLQDMVKWKPVFIMLAGTAVAGGLFFAKQSVYLTNIKMLYAAGMWNMKAIPVIKVTGLLCVCMILGLLFVYLTANLARQGWIFYFITFPLVFTAMMEQVDLDIWTLCLLSVFHLGNRMASVAAKTRQRSGQPVRSAYKSAGRVVPVLVILLLLAMGIAGKGISKHMETLYQVPLKTGDRAWRMAAGLWLPESVKGQVNRGGLYPSGREQMEVILQEKPEEDMYLKNFVGDIYENGAWKAAEQKAFYESLDGQYAAQEGADARKYFENRQFYMIRYILSNLGGTDSDENVPGEKNVELRSLALENRVVSVPYIYGEEYADDKVHRGTMYTEQDFKTVFAIADADTRLRFEEEERVYKTFVEQSCLVVPEEEVPQLVSICRANENAGTEEITEFIRAWLQSKAAYSLNPGVVPIGRDPAEYFICEQGKGYCQHFATAAALMYRIYGIPARYAVGFRAEPDLFEEQEDGRYKAVLTDVQAHAWVEIYSAGEGWIPVETTPAAGTQPEDGVGEKTAAKAAGMENETEPKIPAEQENLASPDEAEADGEPGEEETAGGTENSQEDENKGQKEGPDSKTKQDRKHKIWEDIRSFFVRLAPVFATAAGIIFLWGFISLRRYIILRRQEKYGAGQIMVRMLEVLGMAGKLKDCDAMGADFPENLSGAVPSITRMEAGQMQRAALQESFGNEKLSGMQGREVRHVYKKVCSYVYKKLPWYKKLYFRYGKVYR